MSNLSPKLIHSQLVAEQPQVMSGCAGWVWIGAIDIRAALGTGAGLGDDGIALEDLAVHGSGPLGGFGGGRSKVRQIGPDLPEVDWPQFLAGHDTLGSTFNCKAVLNGNRTSPLDQLIHHGWCYTHNSGQCSLRAKRNASQFDWGLDCVHALTVALLHAKRQAMLHDGLTSIAT